VTTSARSTAGAEGGFEFDLATAVEALSPGRYRAQLSPGWAIAGTTHGGYLLAVATRAAMEQAAPGHDHPIAVSAAYPERAPSGPVEIEVELLRSGRSTSVLRSRLVADGTVRLEALVTAGRLDGDLLHSGPPSPAMPPEADCPVAPPVMGPLLDRLVERLDPATTGFATGQPAGIGELRAWVRFADGREPDPLSMTLFGDCLAPPTFDLPQVQLGWVPTLQLSVFVRAVPATGPLVIRTVARSVGSGAVDETCDIWDATGRHVAVAHQLAAVRPATQP